MVKRTKMFLLQLVITYVCPTEEQICHLQIHTADPIYSTALCAQDS